MYLECFQETRSAGNLCQLFEDVNEQQHEQQQGPAGAGAGAGAGLNCQLSFDSDQLSFSPFARFRVFQMTTVLLLPLFYLTVCR